MHRDFWSEGYRIFPIWPIDSRGRCTCSKPDCIMAGKHPRASSWQETPIWDEEQLDAMEEFSSLATSYGVLCKGLLVIDVDARNGGIASYKKLLKEIPEIAHAGLVVDTGSGGGSKHLYFTVDSDVALLQHLDAYKGVDFKSTGYVVGPGSKHKSGKTYSTADGSPYDIGPAPEALVALLRRPERHRTEYNGASLDVSHQEIADMLSFVSPDVPHDEWVKIGMSVHHATGGTGFALWDDWSAKGGTYDETIMQPKWHSFGRCANPVTIGTLIYHAEQGGWQAPVTFESDMTPAIEGDDGDPLDTSNVNLKSPPGFVGELAEWIESQNRRPRLNLAVAGALIAIGNVAGLRYADTDNRTVANLLAFCVASSGSGKEAVLQSVNAVMREAGLSAAVHGSIKSEQEIIRNLVRHQAAFYTVDEIGIFLQKIASAQKRGGAVYLEGVIGQIMSIYTKAADYFPLSGDAKEDIRKSLKQELSTLGRKRDEGDMSPAQHEAETQRIIAQIKGLDSGLWRPFLSLIGFTTPVTFDGAVTMDSATNGFFGRAIIFNERDTAPRSKANFRKVDMPEAIRNTIVRIATGESYDVLDRRIEAKGEWVSVPSDDSARALIERARVWFDEQAIEASSRNGLESLWMRGLEQVLKISLILAIPSGLRTAEHVRWAFALVKRDIVEKSQLVISNTPYKEEAGDAMRMKILNMCSDEDGASFGKIKQAMKPRKVEEIEAALTDLVARGRLEKIEGVHKFNKRPFTKYVAAKG